MLHRALLLLFCFGAVLQAAVPVLADEPIRIVTPVRPPYVVDSGNGTADGPAVRLVQRLALEAGIDPAVSIVPFERALLTLDRGNTLYPALLRTADREARFQWIGEVFADDAVLFTRTGTETAGTLADAGRFRSITVMRGSELVTVLRTAGLANFRTADSEIDNARMLAAGRVDAWFATAAVGRATWDGLGLDKKLLVVSAPVEPLSFWVAVSRNVPPAVVDRLGKAFAALRASGEYDRIIAPLRATKQPSEF